MTAEEMKDLKIELRARKIVKRKLEVAIRSLMPKISQQVAAREARKQQLTEYRNYNDLQDAYGWGIITEEEFDRLAAALETGTEAIDKEVTAEEIAKDVLTGWLRITSGDISSLEFEMLPEKKQIEILEQNYEIAKRRQERRANNET